MGKHTLEATIADMMKEAGVVGRFTLHSLRATCATRLYNKGVDEQAIKEVTGHNSSAVREYKRTEETMKKYLSSTIQGTSGSSVSSLTRQEEGAIVLVRMTFLFAPLSIGCLYVYFVRR